MRTAGMTIAKCREHCLQLSGDGRHERREHDEREAENDEWFMAAQASDHRYSILCA